MADRERSEGRSLGYAFASIAAIVVALIFLFPFYWAFSTSLRNPIDTFTVAGLGIPWIDFEPTIANWAQQLATAEALKLFDIPFALTGGGPGIATQSYSFLAFRVGLRYFDLGYASAMAYVLLIVVMIIVTFFFRRLRETYA